MRKIVRREKQNAFRIHSELRRKYLLPLAFKGWCAYRKVEKGYSYVTKRIVRDCLEAIREHNERDKTLYVEYYLEKLAYKVLYGLKTYSRRRKATAVRKGLALKLLGRHLSAKVLKALVGRVQKNQQLRRDPIKSYYIDNSEDEDDTYLPEDAAGAVPRLKDEFFPVTIYRRKQLLEFPDLKETFMYDVLEANPEFLVLNDRSYQNVNVDVIGRNKQNKESTPEK